MGPPGDALPSLRGPVEFRWCDRADTFRNHALISVSQPGQRSNLRTRSPGEVHRSVLLRESRILLLASPSQSCGRPNRHDPDPGHERGLSRRNLEHHIRPARRALARGPDPTHQPMERVSGYRPGFRWSAGPRLVQLGGDPRLRSSGLRGPDDHHGGSARSNPPHCGQ